MSKIFCTLSFLKNKAVASVLAAAVAVLVPAMAFAADLETGAKAEITTIVDTVGTVGVAVLAVVGAIVAVQVVMRMLKKS